MLLTKIKGVLHMFSAQCIDNFYDDPDSVREFALKQEFTKDENGYWPGKRTKLLYEIDKDFFDFFCQKLMATRFDLTKNSMSWVIDTGFQIIEPLSPNKNSIKNQGYIHKDNCIFAGLVYLNPKIDLSCGTSIYNLVDETKIDESDTKSLFYKNGIDKNFDKKITEHNNAFVETIRFNNVYNRLISFDGQAWHKANNFYSNVPRLTQVFFVFDLKYNSPGP